MIWCLLLQVGNVAFPNPKWGAWYTMFVCAENGMKLQPIWGGSALGVWIAGLMVTGIILTGKQPVLVVMVMVTGCVLMAFPSLPPGPVGVSIYTLIAVKKLWPKSAAPAKKPALEIFKEEPKPLRERWNEFYQRAMKEIKEDLSRREKFPKWGFD